MAKKKHKKLIQVRKVVKKKAKRSLRKRPYKKSKKKPRKPAKKVRKKKVIVKSKHKKKKVSKKVSGKKKVKKTKKTKPKKTGKASKAKGGKKKKAKKKRKPNLGVRQWHILRKEMKRQLAAHGIEPTKKRVDAFTRQLFQELKGRLKDKTLFARAIENAETVVADFLDRLLVKKPEITADFGGEFEWWSLQNDLTLRLSSDWIIVDNTDILQGTGVDFLDGLKFDIERNLPSIHSAINAILQSKNYAYYIRVHLTQIKTGKNFWYYILVNDQHPLLLISQDEDDTSNKILKWLQDNGVNFALLFDSIAIAQGTAPAPPPSITASPITTQPPIAPPAAAPAPAVPVTQLDIDLEKAKAETIARQSEKAKNIAELVKTMKDAGFSNEDIKEQIKLING